MYLEFGKDLETYVYEEEKNKKKIKKKTHQAFEKNKRRKKMIEQKTFKNRLYLRTRVQSYIQHNYTTN